MHGSVKLTPRHATRSFELSSAHAWLQEQPVRGAVDESVMLDSNLQDTVAVLPAYARQAGALLQQKDAKFGCAALPRRPTHALLGTWNQVL